MGGGISLFFIRGFQPLSAVLNPGRVTHCNSAPLSASVHGAELASRRPCFANEASRHLSEVDVQKSIRPPIKYIMYEPAELSVHGAEKKGLTSASLVAYSYLLLNE